MERKPGSKSTEEDVPNEVMGETLTDPKKPCLDITTDLSPIEDMERG